MNKILLIAFLTFCSSLVYSQNDIFFFKKGHKTIKVFTKDSYIAFQSVSGEWFSGYIKKVKEDSFYLKPLAVRYNLMSIDTLAFDVLKFSMADVYAMPKQGIQIDYKDGRFQITRSGGHVHWYWVKSGWIFRFGGGGYILLNILNGLIQNNFSFTDARLPIAASVFLFGEVLRRAYTPTLKLGKKYHLQYIKASQ